MLATQCPHRICLDCYKAMGRDTCPVCGTSVPEDTPLDAAWPRQASAITLQCDCGAVVPLLEADEHTCEQTRKRLRPSQWTTMGPAARRARPPPPPNRSTFTCPICGERNLTREGLVEHGQCRHAGDRVACVCPICAAMPWGDPTYVSRDFLSHLRLRHRCDYEVLADFDADEEDMVRRALEASAREAELALERALRESAMEAGVPYEGRDGDEGTGSGGGGVSSQAGNRPARRSLRSSGSATSSGSEDENDEAEAEEVDRAVFGSSRATASASAAFPMPSPRAEGGGYPVSMATGHRESVPNFMQRGAADSFPAAIAAGSPSPSQLGDM